MLHFMKCIPCVSPAKFNGTKVNNKFLQGGSLFVAFFHLALCIWWLLKDHFLAHGASKYRKLSSPCTFSDSSFSPAYMSVGNPSLIGQE